MFSAQVIEVEELAGFERIQIGRLKVLKSWKGPHAVGSGTMTATQIQDDVCGIEVAVNQTLLVYVSGDAPYRLSTCSRTQSLSSATEETRILDRLAADSAKRPSKAN
ncbi:hypothetical protein [Steroidobacter agaridevorans]|uniref:hypothetical protein n=1 Tax=Steroidobacter agaridevorans TaxID=2695856 RepID=UPI00137988F1|nr:hypothetical protein [Steroidobacter agaridevorans]